jgi:nicotinamidase-related amidase
MERPLITLDELVDPRHAALLVIDVQKDYCSPRLYGSELPMVQEMLPRLQRLMDAARQAGVQLIHVRMEHPDWTNSVAWMRRKWDGTRFKPERCQPGTEGAEFMPGFEPREGEIVVVKHRNSAFVSTNLEMVLHSLGIQTVITTGAATNNCVESTARHACWLDFYVVFPSDATASYDALLHETALTNVRNHYGVVATADEIMACWQRATPRTPEMVPATARA